MMKSLFETLQLTGSIGMIFGTGWLVGMVIGAGTEKGSVWLVAGPILVSVLVMFVGWVLEAVFKAGIRSTNE